MMPINVESTPPYFEQPCAPEDQGYWNCVRGQDDGYNVYLPFIANQLPPTPSGGSFTIATFNTHDGSSAPAAPYIEENTENVDFIALQEAEPSEVTTIQQALGWGECLGRGNMQQLCDVDPDDGIKFIGNPDFYSLPPCGDDSEARDLVVSRTESDGEPGPLVGATHLCHRDEENTNEALDRIIEEIGEPIVIAADFNRNPDELVARWGLTDDQMACNEPSKPCPGDLGVRGPVDNIVLFGGEESGEIVIKTGERWPSDPNVSDHTGVEAEITFGS